MLYPSIQEMLKLSSDKNGEQRLNKYTLVMATAKCARIITNECVRAREYEKVCGEKADLKKEYKDEKAVKNAVRELNDGEYEILFEGDEGYENSVVDVRAFDAELEKELLEIKEDEKVAPKTASNTVADTIDEEETQDLMNASEVYADEVSGFSESDEPTDIIL